MIHEKQKQPWFLDGKLTTTFRNAPHIDGSFLSKVSDYGVRKSDQIIMPCYDQDPAMADLAILDFIKTVSPDAIFDLIEKGKTYAKVMEESGEFNYLAKL